MSKRLWGFVGLAFLGTLLIVNQGVMNINKGDLLTVLCALLATGQIYLIGLVSPRVLNPFIFNAAQILWAALACLPLLALEESSRQPILDFPVWPVSAQVGLVSLVIGSTLIAFTLQVRAQAHLRPTVSSLLFLLESPFAMAFSLVLLGERLGWMELLGAVLILLGAVGAIKN